MRIVIAGGGTAGHVYPGLAVGRELRARGAEVSFLGTETGVEARLVPTAGFPFQVLRARPFVRRVSISAVRAPFVALDAVRECRPIVAGADAVVGMGGYVSVPAVLAARRERVPALLHEQNAVAGLANGALAKARAARVVALSFRDTKGSWPRAVRTAVTGNPVRDEILRVPDEREALAKEARAELELDDHRRTVLVFDRAAIGACRLLGDRVDLQIVMVTGTAHLDIIRRGLWAKDRPDRVVSVAGGPDGLIVRLIGYLDRMDLGYACADLVVARAGATTVAEISVCGLPSLLIPYPYATRRHQEANARAMQRAGAASLLLDDQVSAQILADRIVSLTDHDDRLEAMRERSRAFGKPDAALRLADLVAAVAS